MVRPPLENSRNQRRRAIEALEARAPPQTVWRLWLIVYITNSASEMTDIVSGGALNSTHSTLLHNQVNNITPCITFNANTGK